MLSDVTNKSQKGSPREVPLVAQHVKETHHSLLSLELKTKALSDDVGCENFKNSKT